MRLWAQNSVVTRIQALALILFLVIGLSSCMSAYKKSVGGEVEKKSSRIYLSDFNTAWQGVLESLKSFPIEVSNREAGYIRTKWIDNTAQRNFVDAYVGANLYLKARFRFTITVAKGFFDGRPSVKVSVQKDQLIQQDVLEGWKPQVSDLVEEKTLHYRIGRIVYIRTELARLEEERQKQAIEEFQ